MVAGLKVSEVIILFLTVCLSNLPSLAACSPPLFDEPHWVGSINTTKITEASGIAVSRINPGVLYTHNDGNAGKIFAITTDAQLLATFDPSKTVDDTEDIAIGPGPTPGTSYIYFGDLGSNTASRDKVRVLRMPEPTVDLSWAQNPVSRNLNNVEVFSLAYPDGKYNAETLMIVGNLGELFIVTKQTALARIYRARLSEETTQRQLVRDLLDRAFGGSAGKLVMQALAAKRASAEELSDIRKAIDAARNDREVRRDDDARD